MDKVIVITSGKGGVGKTTTTANIGTGLALLGKRVVLVDTDIGLRNLDVVLGLENRIVFDLVDVVEGTCRLKQALIRDKRYEGLFLLPAAQTRNKTAVTPEQMKTVIIAYEPVWAIGTGLTATPEQAEETCAVIRKTLASMYGEEVAEATTIQYGGSMNEKNAAELLSKTNVDGGLIGGASLVAEKFTAIVDAAQL